MKTLDKGTDKIKQICDVLRKETLEPAKEESERVIADARGEADRIIKEAKVLAQEIIAKGREALEKERSVFESSLEQAGRQGVESLRQEIEGHLFGEQIDALVCKGTSEPKTVAMLIKAIVDAVEKEGLSADLSAVIPKAVSAESVNQELASGIIDKLKEHSVEVGRFTGGAQVKLNDKKMTIDISDQALKELLAQYIRKDFRKLIFGE